jgi:SAM-dependent methyltransferase
VGSAPGWQGAAVTGLGDADGPNIARVYDYLLGGSHNFAADRAAAEEFLARWPDARQTMRVNREFLGRAVGYLAGQAGIGQFLDIGSGIPTMGNVHQIAQQASPAARVVYVDIDPVAVAHSQAILAGNDCAAAVQADLRRPGEILGHPGVLRLVDLSRPVGLLLVAVLHFIPNEGDPAGLIAELRDALAPGSYVVISHGTTDGQPRHVAEAMEHYARTTALFRPRSHAEIAGFFAGLELIEPGLVRVPLWRPDSTVDAEDAGQFAVFGGVGRKP